MGFFFLTVIGNESAIDCWTFIGEKDRENDDAECNDGKEEEVRTRSDGDVRILFGPDADGKLHPHSTHNIPLTWRI